MICERLELNIKEPVVQRRAMVMKFTLVIQRECGLIKFLFSTSDDTYEECFHAALQLLYNCTVVGGTLTLLFFTLMSTSGEKR